jgi:hypothetical protein
VFACSRNAGKPRCVDLQYNGILEEPVPDQAGNGADNQREPGVTQSYGRSPSYVDAVVPEPGVFYPAKSQPDEECGNENPKNHVAPQKGPMPRI